MSAGTAVDKTEEDFNKALEVREKPLNQSQLKNLKELVGGDFTDLRITLDTEVDNRLSKKEEAINAKFDKEADLGKAQQKLKDEARKAEDKLRALVEKFKEQGIEVATNRYHSVVEVSVQPEYLTQTGREKELRAAKDAAYRMKNHIIRVLSREERAIQRMVLLQGIGATGALELVRDLPEPADILTMVAAELQASASDDLKTLMTEEELAAAKELETA